MSSLDKRLFQHNQPSRTLLFAAVAVGFVAAVLLAAQAWFLSDVVTRVSMSSRGDPAERGRALDGARDQCDLAG